MLGGIRAGHIDYVEFHQKPGLSDKEGNKESEASNTRDYNQKSELHHRSHQEGNSNVLSSKAQTHVPHHQSGQVEKEEFELKLVTSGGELNSQVFESNQTEGANNQMPNYSQGEKPFKRKVFERLTSIKLVVYLNIISFPLILAYFMIIISIWRVSPEKTYLVEEIITCACSDLLGILIWAGFFYSIYRKDPLLIRRLNYLLLVSAFFKAVCLGLSERSSTQRKIVSIAYWSDIIVKLLYIIIYELVRWKMNKTPIKGWRKAWKRKKKMYDYTW